MTTFIYLIPVALFNIFALTALVLLCRTPEPLTPVSSLSSRGRDEFNTCEPLETTEGLEPKL